MHMLFQLFTYIMKSTTAVLILFYDAPVTARACDCTRAPLGSPCVSTIHVELCEM